MIDRKLLTDRLLQAENLTDNLEDDDAQFLLEWGVSQIPVITNETLDAEYADQRVMYLMRTMRALNRIAGNWPDLEPRQLAELLEFFTAAYAANLPAAGADYQSIVAALADMEIRPAIEYLINWCSSQK